MPQITNNNCDRKRRSGNPGAGFGITINYLRYIYDYMQPLLLLHGAIGASGQLRQLAARLSQSFKVYTLDFTGHGNTQMPGVPFSMTLFEADVLRFMKNENLEKVSIFGYSMGGYVAMCLAKHHPEKVDKIVTLATKFHWDKETAAREIQMLNPEKIEQKLPAFAETLKTRHAPNDWKAVLSKTADMMVALGDNNTLIAADYAGVNISTLLLLGDRDKMVTLDETEKVFRSLPGAQLGILPGTPHPIEQVDLELLSFNVTHFLLQ